MRVLARTVEDVRRIARSDSRVPPQNVEAEESVLGAMMLSSEAIADVVEVLQADDFYRSANGRIYEVLRGLYAKGEPVDIVTGIEALKRAGMLEDVGGPLYMRDLVEQVPTPASAQHYARIVSQTALLRRLIGAAADIMDMAYAAPADPEGVADDAEQRIYDVARREDADEVAILRDLVDQAMVDLENIQNRDTAYTGLPSGFRDLDDLTSGLQPGNLIVIAARPGVGKSSLATNIARNVAIGRHPVALFSLEMSRYEIGMRLLCSEAKVAWDRIRNKRVGPDDWSRVVQAAEVLHDVPLHIVDAGNVNIVDIRAKARRMRTGRQGLELIIVDYLQLMTSPLTRRPDNRQQEVAEISRSLKLLAKELHVPVIALSPAQPQPGGPRRQAAAAVGPARVGCHRTGLRCRHVHPPRRRRPREEAPDRAHHREAPQRTHRQHPAGLRAVAHAVPQRRSRRGRSDRAAGDGHPAPRARDPRAGSRSAGGRWRLRVASIRSTSWC